MAHLATRECSCEHTTYMGQKRPEFCSHGNRFLTQAEREPRRRHGSTISQRQPKRDWTDARAKVEEEGCCRICKRTDRPVEAAHVLGREHDEPKISKTTGEILQELYVHPDRVFPACGPFPEGCHGDQHANKINVLHHLTLDEQIQAVRDLGGIAPAFLQLTPVRRREEVEASSPGAIELESPKSKEAALVVASERSTE